MGEGKARAFGDSAVANPTLPPADFDYLGRESCLVSDTPQSYGGRSPELGPEPAYFPNLESSEAIVSSSLCTSGR